MSGRLLLRGQSPDGGKSKFFLDTSIFIASFDRSRPRQSTDARLLIRAALNTGLGVVSGQVVQEFLSAAMDRFAVPLMPADCRTYLSRVLAPLWRVTPTADLHRRALDIHEQAERQAPCTFGDCLIIAAAQETGCRTLYSEDLPHRGVFDRLVIVNPFIQSALLSPPRVWERATGGAEGNSGLADA
jgi:predicted nucleic acid-binding protein